MTRESLLGDQTSEAPRLRTSPDAGTDRRPRRLVYICLQATREGQASYAHVHEIIKGLARRGWEVQLVEPSYARSGRPPGPLGRLLEFTRIQLGALRPMSGADVVYIRAHFAAVPAALWASMRRRRVVQELNGAYEDMFVAWPRLQAVRPLLVAAQRTQLHRASLVITVTEGLASWTRRDARPKRVAVVPNGADTDLFTPSGPVHPGLPARFVGFVGSLAGWHGVDTMLQATRQSMWPDDVSLVVVGDGARAADIRRASQLDGRVVQLGMLPYREIPSIIRGATAMLSVQPSMPTTSIGGLNPLKVFESLACGVPVIVSDHPGQADLVRREGCGWVVPPGDPASVAMAVADAVAQPERSAAMGQSGRRAIVREHSWDARAAATDSVLRELIGADRW